MADNGLNKAATFATLFIVCGAFFIDIANLGMANIALPTIQKALGFDDGTLQWVLTAYALTFGGFLMACGRLGDIFGHGNILLLGMTLFNAATLLCALIDNQVGLVIGRAVQGLGAAFTIPPAQSMVSLLFQDPSARIKAFAAWGACGSTGFVVGPIIGGLLTSLVSWNWIFWISLICEGALEIAALALLFSQGLPGAPPPKDANKSRWIDLHSQVDALGAALSVPSMALLVYGLTTGNIHGWNKPDVIACLATAVVLVASFIAVEVWVAANPILPKYIWGDRTRAVGCLLAALTYAVWQGCNYLLTLQLQGFGFSAVETAVRFLPLGITAMAVNFVIPTISKHIRPRVLLVISWLAALIGLVLFTRMESEDDYWRYCLPGMILYITGICTVYFVGNVTVVASAPSATQGTVSGVYNMFLNVGGAVVGVALLTVISNTVTSNEGGKTHPGALLAGYRAGYYASIAMTGIGVFASLLLEDKK
ncbi:Major facilitator superfamily domain, general substrate transporter [Metarhizium guizhouense ARSEF 977]|uniref:Major facilitator superfamily domain, general substrate transporter n=1 Tax=Metarhizium guizhouense (strain ARSEF 977) TaxID=1276136 RepID=A0A0B4GXI3_METGA|nr:Major facilitator superfamily domain, general substrate transporter [Metarhizium guizhouense ARSEF 977]